MDSRVKESHGVMRRDEPARKSAGGLSVPAKLHRALRNNNNNNNLFIIPEIHQSGYRTCQ